MRFAKCSVTILNRGELNMKHLIKLSILVFSMNACSDNSQNLKHETVEKDYLEEYYELEEERHNEYIASLN